MITFLSSPKSFSGPAFKNQINAIQSWLHVASDVEVILYGDSLGCEAVSKHLGARHVKDVVCSPSGVPYFNAIADHAQRHAQHDVQMYLNCDILLTDAILDAVKMVNFPKFVMVGQRIDIGENTDVTFRKDDWQGYVRNLITCGNTRLHPPSGMDYFIFPRGLWQGLDPLVIGRAGYDSALVAFCLRRNIPVIDATYEVPAIHQHHEYGHVKGGHEEILSGIDAKNNLCLHKVVHSSPNTVDATWLLHNGRLVPNNTRGDYIRHFESYLRYKRNMLCLSYAIRAIWRVLTGINVYKIKQLKLRDVTMHINKQ